MKRFYTVISQHYPVILAMAVCCMLLLSSLINNQLYANVETEERFGISFPKLSPITMPEITQYRMKNGITVLLCEDQTFPTISIDISNSAGSIHEAVDKTGLASLTSQLLRSGGTKKYSPSGLNTLLDNSAIHLSTGNTVLSGSVYMRFLSEDTRKALDILNEVMRSPAFDEDAFNTAKRGVNTSISRRNDDMSGIAFREFHKLVYDQESPFARHTEYSTIANISREDLIQFHQEHYLPQTTYISVVGDFKTRDMKKLLNQTLGKWKTKATPRTIEHDKNVDYEGSVNLISRPEAKQTWIVLGHRAEMTQRDDDYIPMIILNDILGGGFTSRIYRRVRNQLGLAYAPGAYYSVHYDSYGAFYLMSQTTTEKTVEAIEALIDEVRIIQNEPVSEEELYNAKESYLNSFIFNYDATWKILNRQMVYMRFGYPEDFLEQVRNRVYDVTVADIQRVARKYLRPDDLIVLAVGNDEDFDRPLSSLGKVNTIDITIPQPRREEDTEITEEGIEEAHQVFNHYRKAAGLEQEIKTIQMKSVSTQYSGSDSSRVSMQTFIKFPDRFKQNMTTPRGDISMIYNQGNTTMKTPAGNYPLPAEFRDRIVSEIRSNPIGLANHYYEDYEVSLVREVSIDGRDCFVLSFKDKDRFFLLFIDKIDMLPYQSVYDDYQAMKTIYIRFSDYQTIDGVAYPMKIITQDEQNQVISRSVYSEVIINATITDELFLTE